MELRKKQTIISGWNNVPATGCDLVRPEKYSQLSSLETPFIARGMGRSYGDAAINSKGIVVLMERLNRFISFDAEAGLLKCEGGTTIQEILEVFTPKKWFLPVVPGTQHATVGGCIAADVHGKNHFADGTFSRFVHEMTMILPDGSKKICSANVEPELFWATVGGMGLTGVIGEAVLKLNPIESAYLIARHELTMHLPELFEKMENQPPEDKYTVAWIDPYPKEKEAYRSVIIAGRHASHEETIAQFPDPLKVSPRLQFSLPSAFSSLGIPSWSIKAFNKAYFNKMQQQSAPHLIDYSSFFFPLDKISNWNRIFGNKGFIQYQFAIPREHARASISMILEETANSRFPCSLAVLKRFGPKGKGLLSFPLEGYSLALDFPYSERLLPFLNKLDSLVLRYLGRIYLAKDMRLPYEHLEAMYPQLNAWKTIKKQIDPEGKIASDFSRRLHLESRGER